MESTTRHEAQPSPSHHTPETQPPSKEVVELVGGLQAVLLDSKLRDFSLTVEQEAAIASIGESLLDGHRTGHVDMATSTGKTAIESLFAEGAVRSGKRVLLLAPKITIARQLSGTDGDRTTGLKKFTRLHDTIRVGHQFGGATAQPADDVVVSTYSSFLGAAKENFKKLGTFDVIIADECHRGLGQQTAEALVSSFPDAIKIGFSATPDFAIDRRSEEVFGDKLFEFSLVDAIEAGRTAPLRTLVYETDQTLELYDARADFTERELAPLIENPERNGTALELIKSFVEDGRQGVVACIPGAVNAHARILRSLIETKGITAFDIGSHLSDEENSKRLQLFEEGEVKVLLSTRALEEGWDTDKASFAINMAPTSSPVRTKQFLGRVLRRKEDGRESIYVDFIDTRRGLDKTQYTALHAVDIDTVEIGRVLGSYRHSETKWGGNLRTLLPNISDDVMGRLMRSNGRKINDILLPAEVEKADPLAAYWESVLSEEGMPSELPFNEFLGKRFEAAYKKTARGLARRLGESAVHHDTIIAELLSGNAVPKFIRERLVSHGQVLSYEQDVQAHADEQTLESLPEQLVAPLHSPYEALARAALKQQLGIPLVDKESVYELTGKNGVSFGKMLDTAMHRSIFRTDKVDYNVDSFVEQFDAPAEDIRRLIRAVSQGTAHSSILSEREQGILTMHFGLTPDGTQHTLDQIADTFGVNRERIRQIESKALDKLRVHARHYATYEEHRVMDEPLVEQNIRGPITFAAAYEKHIASSIAAFKTPHDKPSYEKQAYKRALAYMDDRNEIKSSIEQAKKDYPNDIGRRLEVLEHEFSHLNTLLAVPVEYYRLTYAAKEKAFTDMRQTSLIERIRYYQSRIRSLKQLGENGVQRHSNSIQYLHTQIYMMQKAVLALGELRAVHAD
jgi:superfamily II DNA or RNA helicase